MSGLVHVEHLPVEVARGREVFAAQGRLQLGEDVVQILREDLRIPIVRAHETIEAAPADPDVARKLNIPVLFPVMHMKRVMFTTKDRPFELVETFYRADTVGGQSGSPVWKSGYYGIAIHAYGLHGVSPHSTNNHGTRFISEVFNNMTNWKNAP